MRYIQKDRLMKKSESWRCIMTAAYFLNGKELYEGVNANEKTNRQDFALQTHKKLKEDKRYYKQILGADFIKSLKVIGELP
jgi:hypothetical protein